MGSRRSITYSIVTCVIPLLWFAVRGCKRGDLGLLSPAALKGHTLTNNAYVQTNAPGKTDKSP